MNETVETAEKIEARPDLLPPLLSKQLRLNRPETPETIEESSLLNSDMTEEAKETEEKQETEKEAGAPEKYEDGSSPLTRGTRHQVKRLL